MTDKILHTATYCELCISSKVALFARSEAPRVFTQKHRKTECSVNSLNMSFPSINQENHH